MAARVIVVGGGYGGAAVAKALDEVADVVLVEPRDAFVHNVAALRGLVDPQWTDRLFLPYDRLLNRGRVLHDRAVRVDADSVTVGAGDHLAADYIVLATGSAYPFPAKTDVDDSTTAKAKLRDAYEVLAQADRVLLVGAGPVGLELAGEIMAAWPDKAVTVLDRGADILSGGFSSDFRAELRRQLDGLGVELLLGASLHEQPPSAPGEYKPFTALTDSGRELAVEVWFRCYGVLPISDYLADELSGARRADGFLEVTPELRLPGQEHVFAIGDLTAIPETKMAKAAKEHAAVVATNLRTLIDGGTQLVTYQPSPAGIALPLGPHGGASYLPGTGVIGAEGHLSSRAPTCR
ncbi:MAG: FAD-dependent oxidoreductase [Pseudonocardiaceae bacterium]